MSMAEACRELDQLFELRVRLSELEGECDVLAGEAEYWRGEAEKARRRVEQLEIELATANAKAPGRGW